MESSSPPRETNSLSLTNVLEWNKKKQDMIINLGLTNNQSGTDQTPTPTRFIRNCERVGLFQDLQNVNPFDEVFKKAIDNPSSGPEGVEVDELLQTPEICQQTITKTSNNDCSLIMVPDFDKRSIQRVIPVPIKRLLSSEAHAEILNKKEANRESQNRCRKRKQLILEKLKNENQLLREENKRLKERIRLLESKQSGKLVIREEKNKPRFRPVAAKITHVTPIMLFCPPGQTISVKTEHDNKVKS